MQHLKDLGWCLYTVGVYFTFVYVDTAVFSPKKALDVAIAFAVPALIFYAGLLVTKREESRVATWLLFVIPAAGFAVGIIWWSVAFLIGW